MILRNCCICLKSVDEPKILNSEDDYGTKLLTKLQYIAPEYEWLKVFSLCQECSTQLDNAYNFKQLCFTHDSYRKRLLLNTTDEKDDINIFYEDIFKLDTPSICAESEEELLLKTESLEIEGNFICHHCDQNFKLKSLLERHLGIKHKNNCKICGNTFSSKKKLRIHRTSEHKEKPAAKFQCELCGEQFFLLKNILEHCISIHSMNRKDVKPYRCDQCNNKFTSSTLLIQHKKYHAGKRSFICTVCGKSFITRRDLNGHEKVHNNQRSYNCDKCEKSFNTSQNLKTHTYVVHTDSSHWKHSCPICSKRFAMKANCKEHVRRHQGNKEFLCYICKKTFVSSHEVKKHMKIHSNIASFQCTHCQKHYRDKRSLDIHLAKLHGVGTIKPRIREKKFVCHICSSQFFDNSKLQRHIRTHTGVKPFGCSECEKRFIDKSYLSNHIKSVHKVANPVGIKEELILEEYFQ